jgi:DNA-binding NtrC family response regulator
MDNKREQDQPLQGMRILVADDEFLIAVTIEETLSDAGAKIVGASTLAAALKTANDESIAAAVLDVRLGLQTTETVADTLAARGVPFILNTGQSLPDSIHDKRPDVAVLIRPADQGAFVDAVLKATGHC